MAPPENGKARRARGQRRGVVAEQGLRVSEGETERLTLNRLSRGDRYGLDAAAADRQAGRRPQQQRGDVELVAAELGHPVLVHDALQRHAELLLKLLGLTEE